MTGSAGAVEGSARVRITNVDASDRGGATVRTTTTASADGSFQTTIPAQLGDELRLVAIDAAGNESAPTTITAGPSVASLQINVVGENGQVGVAGNELPDPVTVKVRGAVSGTEVPGVTVRFEAVEGGGTLSDAEAVTDEKGNASTTYTLGPGEGENRIVARIVGAEEKETTIRATAVGPPRIDAVEPGEARPGEIVTVEGENFSPIARHNVVRFGEEAGTVVEATGTSLEVEVPPFATMGPLTVELTDVVSNEVPYDVLPAQVEERAPGEVDLVTIADGEGRIELPFGGADQEFTLVVQSLSATDRTFTTSLRGAAARFSRMRVLAGAAKPARELLEARIREFERRVVPGLPRRAPARVLAPAQEVGSQRTFQVINTLPPELSLTNEDHFTEVTATLRFAGENTLLYVDDRTPDADLPQTTIDAIGGRFDDGIHPTNVDAFGRESDIDDNGKVIILMTPAVNALTSREDFTLRGQFIAGFFFAIDLFPDPVQNPFANGGELFYSVIPDPDAEFGPARISAVGIQSFLSSIFAHEHQHMISANFHLRPENPSPDLQQEELWLAEGLSHVAEAINGFLDGNHLNASLFLEAPGEVTLLGGGNLVSERGAVWLFVEHLADRFGEGVLAQLVQTTMTGIDNVESATGEQLETLFHAWATALLLDGTGLAMDPRFTFPSLDLRGFFERVKAERDDITGDYLNVRDGGELTETSITVTQKGTSPVYIRFTARGRATVPVRIEGDPEADLQIGIVRTE
ncbi:MAG: Ig-like domain-containing protein [Gemmatimonadota bacterium]|nr:Ig-like domain-containing protein [Gemmatimonadota bacterium]